MMLVAAERKEEKKENACPTATVIAQVEGEFKARGFAVSLAKSTVNRYIQNDMVRSAPLALSKDDPRRKRVFQMEDGRDVTIHNLRTVALRYGELLALLQFVLHGCSTRFGVRDLSRSAFLG